MYDETFINKFLTIYFNLLKNYVSVDNNTEIFVLEKQKPKFDSEKDLVKDGIHIMIPNIVTFPNIQYMLRYKMIHEEETIELLNSISVINDIDDVIDIRVIEKNNWQMYGSRKPNCEAYLVTKIYNYDNDSIEIIENSYNDKQLLNLLSLRNISKNDVKNLKEDIVEEFDREYDNIPSNFKLKKTKKRAKKKKKRSPTRRNNTSLIDTSSFDKIKQLIDILDVKRAENYDKWIQLGWCLHNLDENLLPLWIEFSKKSSKYEEGVCEYEWDRMDANGLGLGSLYMWAKEDNFGKYKEITANDLRKVLMKSLTATHHDIAKVMHHLYKDEFICSKSKCWYNFRNHKWVRINNGMELQMKISKNLVNEYLKYAAEVSITAQQLDDDEPQKEILLERLKKISGINIKLKTTSFKKNIMEECNELFYNSDFEDLLDSNVYLIGFENGVYDLKMIYSVRVSPKTILVFQLELTMKSLIHMIQLFKILITLSNKF